MKLSALLEAKEVEFSNTQWFDATIHDEGSLFSNRVRSGDFWWDMSCVISCRKNNDSKYVLAYVSTSRASSAIMNVVLNSRKMYEIPLSTNSSDLKSKLRSVVDDVSKNIASDLEGFKPKSETHLTQTLVRYFNLHALDIEDALP